jgi:hypothetical protein
LRRYVAPSTLPTPISPVDEAAQEESTRAVSPRGDSRLDSGLNG